MYDKVIVILALAALATALVLCPRKAKRRRRLGVVHQLVVLMIGLVIYGVVFILLLVWVLGFTAAMGPIAGALISAIAVMSYDTATHYLSTSELELSLGVGGNDPGLDVEVFKGPHSIDTPEAKALYRISAMIFNWGDSIVKDAKASLTIKVRDGRDETYYLRDILISKDLCNKMFPVGANYLVNENNPHVIGEELSWALPEKAIPVTSARSQYYQYYKHITSISPGQRSRLLIFDFVNVTNIREVGEGEVEKINAKYIITPYSEYGDPGPRRACLRLSDNYELIFEVTVYGEGARSPLRFVLCISVDKLQKIENALQRLAQDGAGWRGSGNSGGSKLFEELLEALKSLKCAEGQPGGLRALAKKFVEWLGGCLS